MDDSLSRGVELWRRVLGQLSTPCLLPAASVPSRAASDSGTQRNVNVLAANLDGMGGHRLDGRHAERAAGPDIEARSVARTFDLAAGEHSLGQRPTIVRAHVVDGVEPTRAMEDGDGATVHLDECLPTRG